MTCSSVSPGIPVVPQRKRDIEKPRSYGANTMKTKDYQIAPPKRLREPECAAGYLTDVLETESQVESLMAIKNVLDAR